MPGKSTAQPTGTCWCDCGHPTSPGSYFVQGHDRRASRYLTAAAVASPSIAEQLAAAGFTPGSGKSLREAALAGSPAYEECGMTDHRGKPCRVVGLPARMRRHRAAVEQHPSQ